MAQFAVETFTDGNGTTLVSHTSDSGHAWFLSGISDSPGATSALQINSNRARASSGMGLVAAYLNATSPAADYSVTMDVIYGGDGTTEITGPGLRVAASSTAAGSFGYFFYIRDTANTGFRLRRYDANVASANLVTLAATVTTGVIYRLTITAAGSTISAKAQRLSDGFWLNSSGTWQSTEATCCSVTDTTYSAAGRPGFITYGAGSVSSVDNLSADAAGASGPTITTQPSDQLVASGASFTFSVAAAARGGGALSYQWKKNGTNIGGATSASYTGTAGTDGVDGDAFSCAVAETGGTSPGITATSAATLTVSAGSSPKASYRYRFRRTNANL